MQGHGEGQKQPLAIGVAKSVWLTKGRQRKKCGER